MRISSSTTVDRAPSKDYDLKVPIPDIERNNVVTAFDVLEGKAAVGNKVVVWGGRAIEEVQGTRY